MQQVKRPNVKTITNNQKIVEMHGADEFPVLENNTIVAFIRRTVVNKMLQTKKFKRFLGGYQITRNN